MARKTGLGELDDMLVAVGDRLIYERARVGIPAPVRVMRCRTAKLGGTLSIRALEGGGTVVSCAVPLIPLEKARE